MKYVIGIASPTNNRSPNGVTYIVKSAEFEKADFDQLQMDYERSRGSPLWSHPAFQVEEFVEGDEEGFDLILRRHFGCEIRRELFEIDPIEEYETTYFIQQSKDVSNQRPVNFGQHLEEVKTALRSMSEYLRGINDPDVLTSELKTTRSYIDASLCFFDENKYALGVPNEVPAEIAIGVKDQLQKTDWTKTSQEARAWAKTVIDAITAWFKFGGGF